MKNILITFGILVLFVSCGSSGKKNTYSTPVKKYITVVGNDNRNKVAYTEDGHIMIYEKDSVGNYIVYYVKFENGLGKYGLKGIEEKIIRAEVDSSLTILSSFLSVMGGSFCELDSLMGYKALYFDEKMKGDSIDLIDVSADLGMMNNNSEENVIKRLSVLLDIAYTIALAINEKNPRGWNSIVYALEPTQSLKTYEVLITNTIYDEKVKKRLPRVWGMNEELTSLNHYLREKKSEENERQNTNN